MLTARVLMLAMLLLATAAGAQTQPPETMPKVAPAAAESPEEVAARVHYERALRAELDGRIADAEQSAQATLAAAGPSGRFADAARALLARLKTRPPPAKVSETSGAISHRVELVTSATLIGLYSGALAAGAGKANAQGTAGLLMLGTGLGLAASLIATSDKIVPGAFAPMMVLGSTYGSWV